MSASQKIRAWFENGLRFECTQCGQCCTGEPGEVRLTPEEAAEIAKYLQLTETAFKRMFCRPGKRLLLKEHTNGDCVFLTNGACSIYPHRPKQCRTYPFWFENIRSEKAWLETARKCPGIGQGRLYTEEEILDRMDYDD